MVVIFVKQRSGVKAREIGWAVKWFRRKGEEGKGREREDETMKAITGMEGSRVNWNCQQQTTCWSWGNQRGGAVGKRTQRKRDDGSLDDDDDCDDAVASSHL